MRNEMKLASAVLAGLLLMGCDSKDNSTTTTTPPANPTATPTMSDKMKDTATDTKNAAGNAMDKMKDTASDATNGMKNAMGTGDTATAAQADLGKVVEAIRDKKWDIADASLKKLEDNKASLPATISSQLPALRTQVDAGKATANMPAMPGMGK